MAITTDLGDFLRTRRERVRPEDVGLPPGTRRRVPGLRREEVALLAGISAEYYLRLEQGRDQHPSDQVVESLARALRLSTDEETHLHELARPRRPRRRRAKPERVRPTVRTLIDSWTTPAMVQTRYGLTLAANPMATALCPYFAPGVNTLRAAFLEPAMRELFRDWEAMTAKSVAYLRSTLGADVADPELRELVGELSLGSERFRVLWARQDVRQQASGLARFQHPLLGPLDLRYEKFAVPGTTQVLVTYHADPGSESTAGLQLLGSLITSAAR